MCISKNQNWGDNNNSVEIPENADSSLESVCADGNETYKPGKFDIGGCYSVISNAEDVTGASLFDTKNSSSSVDDISPPKCCLRRYLW